MILKTSSGEQIRVEDVEMERQAKLFQSIGDSAGDFSYEFEIVNTAENRVKLGIPSPVNQLTKTIYTATDIGLYNDAGEQLYLGYLRITSIPVRGPMKASFFSGNNNWFNMMSGNLEDLDLSEFETEIDATTISDSWSNTSGIVFPILNTGASDNRKTNFSFPEDYHPFIYVKDVVKKCFDYSGLKLSGEILDDWRYNHLLTSNGDREVDQEIKTRATKVSKTSQAIDDDTPEKVLFDKYTDPYYSGILWDTANNRYVADVKMNIKLDLTVTATHLASEGVLVFYYLNGSPGTMIIQIGEIGSGAETKTRRTTITLTLEAGDYVEIFARMIDPDDPGTIDSATLEISGTKLYNAFPKRILPKGSQLEFVTNVFKIFNVVIDYNSFSKTVTVDFFKTVIRNEEIDLSQYIDPETINVDYQELINDYGNSNILKYTEANSDTIESYNGKNTIEYGAGSLTANNDFVDKDIDIVESIFAAAPEDSKNMYDTSLPRLELRETEQIGSEFTGAVTNSGGAKITVSDYNPALNDYIKVTESSTDQVYLGEYIVSEVISGTEFRLDGFDYSSNSTITMGVLRVTEKTVDDQYILLGVPSVNLSEFTDYRVSGFDISVFYAWFYKPNQDKGVDKYDKSLSFGTISIDAAYQKTLIEDYWADLEEILQDPVKVYVDAYLPKPVFDKINFKQPLRIRCELFDARFIPNRITGYKDSSQPCTLELIKLGNAVSLPGHTNPPTPPAEVVVEECEGAIRSTEDSIFRGTEDGLCREIE